MYVCDSVLFTVTSSVEPSPQSMVSVWPERTSTGIITFWLAEVVSQVVRNAGTPLSVISKIWLSEYSYTFSVSCPDMNILVPSVENAIPCGNSSWSETSRKRV